MMQLAALVGNDLELFLINATNNHLLPNVRSVCASICNVNLIFHALLILIQTANFYSWGLVGVIFLTRSHLPDEIAIFYRLICACCKTLSFEREVTPSDQHNLLNRRFENRANCF